MTNAKIKEILIRKGVTHLYHVNTVLTASTYIKSQGLLSRGYVDDCGLLQTPQQSDQRDKEVDVYYDIFFDSVDIHHRIKGLNHYGPVVFVFSIDLIDDLPENSIRITKDNPIRWTPKMEDEEKYFLLEDEVISGFFKGDFTQHITVRHPKVPISFDYLEEIVIDDPGVNDATFFENGYQHLSDLIREEMPDIPLTVRQCPLGCRCQEQYRSYRIGYTYHKFRFK